MLKFLRRRHDPYRNFFSGTATERENIIFRMLADILNVQRSLLVNTQALNDAVSRLQAADTQMLTTLQGVRDTNKQLAVDLEAVRAQLAAIPGDTAAAESAIADAVTKLNDQASQLESAVQQNPNVPDMPPAQVTPSTDQTATPPQA
jgi:2-phospho-L-lactate guanylyltransferase (CobY/MobA/RfbA family)